MQLYSTLVLPMIKESLQNFIDTEIYLCRYEIDYLEKEELYLNSKCLGVGEQIDTSKGKLVKIERIGEINSIGSFDVENNQDFVISSINMIKGETGDKFEARLNESIKTQYNIFHSDLTLVKKWKWVFIEVKKSNINNYNTDCYYKKEQIYSIPLHFDNNGVLLRKEAIKYFQIYKDIYYDLDKRLFIKGNNQIIIKDENEKLFIECLINNYPNNVEKENLMNYIYKDILQRNHNNYTEINITHLLPLKRKFIERYTYLLGINKEIFNKEILVTPKDQGYSIKGKFITEL